MPSSAPLADRGTQRWGGPVEDGAHHRGLVTFGERQAALQQFERVTPSTQRPTVAGFSMNLATRRSRQCGIGLGCYSRRD